MDTLRTPSLLHAERLAFTRAWQAAGGAGVLQVPGLAALYAPDVAWFGCHPLNECRGRDAVLERLWRPLLAAAPDLERHDDIILVGEWRDACWVGATGHFVGTFEHEWLGIPAHGKLLSVRYGEFARFADGAIQESYVILDVLDVMRQAGVWPLAAPLGNVERIPGPMDHDGLPTAPADPMESSTSLALVEAMIAGLMQYDGISLASMAQERFWDVERMLWYGPAGIGTSRGLKGYQRAHQQPFLTAFPDRVGGDHRCRIAEGLFVGSTGWPSIRATHAGGGFLALPPTQRRITMRVMDFWRRDGDRLRENWVFIDLLDLLLQMGVDVLGRRAFDPAGVRGGA